MKDDDAENLAEWLGEKMIESEDNITQEFDQFLAERAAANEKRWKIIRINKSPESGVETAVIQIWII